MNNVKSSVNYITHIICCDIHYGSLQVDHFLLSYLLPVSLCLSNLPSVRVLLPGSLETSCQFCHRFLFTIALASSEPYVPTQMFLKTIIK